MKITGHNANVDLHSRPARRADEKPGYVSGRGVKELRSHYVETDD